MVDLSYQMVLSTLQTAGILVGIAYYLVIMRNSQKTRALALNAQEQALETRQAQLFNSIIQALNEKEIMAIPWELEIDWQYKDYEDFMQKYGPDTNREAYMRFHRLLTYYEGIGIYIKHGLVSAELIDDFISGDIVWIWEKYESFIFEFRKRENAPAALEHFEYLYNQIKPIRDRQHPELKT
jgi:hypothetical protein